MGITAPDRFNRLGAWETKNNNTVYQAATDGFVCANNINTTLQLIGLTDGNNPPTAQRQNQFADGYGWASIMIAVRKGDYWKVTGANTVYFIPLNIVYI